MAAAAPAIQAAPPRAAMTPERSGTASTNSWGHPYAEISRSTGVADIAYALRSGRPHRASGDLAYHVLDAMHAFHDASDAGAHIILESSATRPAPLPMGLREGILDD